MLYIQPSLKLCRVVSIKNLRGFVANERLKHSRMISVPVDSRSVSCQDSFTSGSELLPPAILYSISLNAAR